RVGGQSINALQMSGTDDPDTFTIDPNGPGVTVDFSTAGTAKAATVTMHAPAQIVSIDARAGADTITVGDLGATLVQAVGITTPATPQLDYFAQTDGDPDTIRVAASTTPTSDIVIGSTSVYFHPENERKYFGRDFARVGGVAEVRAHAYAVYAGVVNGEDEL